MLDVTGTLDEIQSIVQDTPATSEALQGFYMMLGLRSTTSR